MEVANIVISGVTDPSKPIHLFMGGGEPDRMGIKSFKTTMKLLWKDRELDAVVTSWATGAVLIRIKRPGEIHDDGEVAEIAELVRKEIMRRIVWAFDEPPVLKLYIQNIVTQVRLRTCVNLEDLYIYIETMRPQGIEVRYRGRTAKRGIYPPACLIYLYRGGRKTTVEIFTTGSIQVKGISSIKDAEETVKEVEELVEKANAYIPCPL
ncbi:MAG: hypothetical protein QXI64_10670 [Sulfolobales archaeon]